MQNNILQGDMGWLPLWKILNVKFFKIAFCVSVPYFSCSIPLVYINVNTTRNTNYNVLYIYPFQFHYLSLQDTILMRSQNNTGSFHYHLLLEAHISRHSINTPIIRIKATHISGVSSCRFFFQETIEFTQNYEWPARDQRVRTTLARRRRPRTHRRRQQPYQAFRRLVCRVLQPRERARPHREIGRLATQSRHRNLRVRWIQRGHQSTRVKTQLLQGIW